MGYSEKFDKPKGTHGHIQWKGTDVCMDFYCECGFKGHVDADFLYFVQCPKCKTKYATNPHVQFVKLTEEDLCEIGDRTIIGIEDEDEDDM